MFMIIFERGISHEATVSETDPGYAAEAKPAETKTVTDNVLIKCKDGYYLERGDGTTSDASKALRFERGEAEKIVAEDRDWCPSVAIEEIPAEKAAGTDASRGKAKEAAMRSCNFPFAPARNPDDFVLIQNTDSDKFFRAYCQGTTENIAEAYRYSRRYAEDYVGYVGVGHLSLRIGEIPAAVSSLPDTWQQRYDRVCDRNARLHGRIAELKRWNTDLHVIIKSLRGRNGELARENSDLKAANKLIEESANKLIDFGHWLATHPFGAPNSLSA